MRFVDTECGFCKRTYKKEVRRFNEANKFGWIPYCSVDCLSKGRNKKSSFICCNTSCRKSIERTVGKIASSGRVFCSRSCAVSVNNKERKSTEPFHNCGNIICRKKISPQNKHCSNKCRLDALMMAEHVTKKLLVNKIKKFHLRNKRIPFKREFLHAKAARTHFGSWNKAVEAAGFLPNPVKFSKKHRASDGHKCDSLAERVIDDWLFKQGIPHERNIPYLNTKYTADFKIGNTLIEYFGLRGQLETYDKNFKRKKEVIDKKNMHVIFIYPEDLIPSSNLKQILGELLQ